MADRVVWCANSGHSWAEGDFVDINNTVNDEVSYKPDMVDYWQSASETIVRKAGDCEDFCILKYALLKQVGYTDMAMIVGQDVWEPDLGGRRQIHALLFVRETDEIPIPKIAKVLDNRTPLIHPDTYYHRFFTPIYAVNEHKTWFYERVRGD